MTYIYDATQEEIEMVEKYQKTGDEKIIRQVIEHPWAYCVAMVMWAINTECHLKEIQELKNGK